jgi:hypothetical protein
MTKYCYKNAKNRCNEPINIDETNHCFGPEGRDCIDCYYPITPICCILDTVTFSLCQWDFLKN